MAEVNNRLDAMTKGHVGIATVEVHTACVGYELDGSRGETWANLYNEAIMNLVKRHPDRFAGIATVPLQDPPRAAKVLEHAIDDLKMSGVTIASNVVGKYFDKRLRSVLGEGAGAGRSDDHASGMDRRRRQDGRYICARSAAIRPTRRSPWAT